jgi:hypothetical protein
LASADRKAAKVFSRDREAPRHASIPCMPHQCSCYVLIESQTLPESSRVLQRIKFRNQHIDRNVFCSRNAKKPPGRSRAVQKRSLNSAYEKKLKRRTRFANAPRPRRAAD